MKIWYEEIDGLPYVTNGIESININISSLNNKLANKSVSQEILHRLYGRENATMEDLKEVLDNE
jgi:hypothetical protein